MLGIAKPVWKGRLLSQLCSKCWWSYINRSLKAEQKMSLRNYLFHINSTSSPSDYQVASHYSQVFEFNMHHKILYPYIHVAAVVSWVTVLIHSQSSLDEVRRWLLSDWHLQEWSFQSFLNWRCFSDCGQYTEVFKAISLPQVYFWDWCTQVSAHMSLGQSGTISW